MPDPEFTNYDRRFCTTIAQALELFNGWFYDPQSGYAVYVVDVETILLNDYRGFQFSVDTGTRLDVFQVAVVTTSEDAPYSVRAAVAGNEFRTIGQVHVNTGSDPDLDFAGFEAYMLTLYLPVKVAILEWLTEQIISVIDTASLEDGSIMSGTVNAVLQFNDGMTYYTATDTYGYSAVDGDGNGGGVLYVTGTSSAAAPAQAATADARIAEALEDIATREAEVSFNHQDTIYSTTSRVKTGS